MCRGFTLSGDRCVDRGLHGGQDDHSDLCLSAPERLAAQRLQRVAAGERRRHRTHSADSPDRHGLVALKDRKPVMRIANEKGIALVLSLFLMTAMSLVAASLMFLAQTETYSSMN